MSSETLGLILDELDCNVVKEYQFDKHYGKRKWRSDFAILDYGILIEYEGLMSRKSRHTTPTGYSKDCEKYNTATLLGFDVLRFTSIMLNNPDSIKKTIQSLIDRKNINQEYNNICCLCGHALAIDPNLFLKTKTGEYKCLMCQWLLDNK